MSVIRCKDCQHFDGIKRCEKYSRFNNRSPYDECVQYPNETNNRDKIENLVNKIQEIIEMEECFFDPEEKYNLENKVRKLLTLVCEHGVYSWKCD